MVGTGILSHDLNRWCYKRDPYIKMCAINKPNASFVFFIISVDDGVFKTR